ncbi:hypothetical protein [Legionella worsleiensis]|uniref:Uncharacterized protein n=1 Tax=Legionella worsleiensis TaxID=45076 RepID=A0A0W1A6D6_9GAMM|nr:hypothetical protein [Legionella worsleiensis]KTD76890.1 hypothetical protein Lwor_2115 [Legionella worsleiensis]STY33440.1 Uncharacterised protein [Legionella worsleiensis]
MSRVSLKNVVVAVSFVLFSLSAYSADTASKSESFQSVCINSWMSKAEQVADKVDYKNFGEKYCACASGQPMDNQVAINKAIQVCLSQTLLHDAMDSLEEEIGLSDAKSSDLSEYCQNRWGLIYPKQTDEEKKFTTSYCACAQPKLMELIKKSETITDKEYDEAIDSIAADCSGDPKVEQQAYSMHNTSEH